MMKTFTVKLILTLLLLPIGSSNAASARETISSGQAVTLCKNKIAEQHADLSRTRTSSIKESRSGFKIKFRVYLSDENHSADCAVSRDGEVTIENH